MPFALGAPFSVENYSGDLLHSPPWRAILLKDIGQRRFTTKASAIVGTGRRPSSSDSAAARSPTAPAVVISPAETCATQQEELFPASEVV